MVVLLGEIIPIGLLLAVGPTRIISTILLLTSAQPMRNALAFLAGSATVYLVLGSLTLLFFGRTLSDIIEGTIILDVIVVLAGITLLVIAGKTLFSAPTSDVIPSRWLQRITAISAGQAFLVGMVLACSLQKLLIFLSGVILIYDAGVTLVQRIVVFLLLVALTLLFQVIPVALYAADASRARVQLSAAMEWLNQHNRLIMTGISLVLGIIFLVVGLTGLIPAVRAAL